MPIETRETDDGPQVSHSCCDVGDYYGSGSIGAANIAWLEEHYPDDCVTYCGSHGYRQVWLPDTEAFRELLSGLDHYPLFDDESHSEIEAQWELEAWDGWLRSDLLRSLDELTRSMASAMEDGELFQCYLYATDSTNTYPVCEESGVHVDVKRIQDAFAAAVELAAINHDRAEDGLPALS